MDKPLMRTFQNPQTFTSSAGALAAIPPANMMRESRQPGEWWSYAVYALVAVGCIVAVAGLLAVYRHRLGVFTRVPAAYPLLILFALPLVAALGGWLLAGRPPPAISRRLSD